MTLSACRAAAPTGETPLHLARVYNGTPLPRRTGTFVSSDADLQAIEDSMRASLAFGGDVNRTGLAWDFAGRTEDYAPRTNVHSGPIDHGTALAPVAIGNYGDLQSELTALSADPNLAALLNVVALPAFPTIPRVQGVGLHLRFDRARVEWSPVTATAAAVLSFSFPLELRDIDLIDFVDLLFDVGPYEVPMSLNVTATPCGDCTNPAVTCRDAPGVIAAGYRTSIATALGYAPSDVNATYPDLGLNFRVTALPLPPATATARLPGITGGTSFTALCPLGLADLPDSILLNLLEDALANQVEVSTLLSLLRTGFGPLRYIVGLIVCELITDSIDGSVRGAMGPIPFALGPALNLLVNPPVLSVPLGSLGPSLPGVPPLTAALINSLRPSVIDRAVIQVGLVGGPAGAPAAPLATPGGAYTDALFNTLASPTGGFANTNLTVNLAPLANACATGVGLGGPGSNDARTCAVCTPPSGTCISPGSGCANFCAPGGGFTRTPVVLPPGPTSSATCATGGICLAPAPNLANLLATAPQFGEIIRRWFATPLPMGARYSAIAPTTTFGSATFSYIIDPDDDCAPEETDTCIGVFDPAQLDDGDGDIYGAACDLCRGVLNSAPDANRDLDADGIPNGCDCDIDGDRCTNEGMALRGPCLVGDDGLFDRFSRIRGPVDFDRDLVNDDCDNDRDQDDVLEQPFDGSVPDNCPVGDNDGIWEPGLDMDQNDDQTDSGGLPAGDLCDLLCPRPGAPLCDRTFDDSGGGFLPGPGGSAIPGIAGLDACVGLAGGACDLEAFLLCPGADYDRCWNPDAFDSIVLVSSLGQTLVQIDAVQLGLTGGFSRSSATIPDIDGDGKNELLFAAPRSLVCPDGKDCFGNVGMLAVFGSQNGKLITRLMGVEAGGQFGTSMAALGDMLAVGAPLANGGAGVVYLYRVDGEGFQLLQTITGERPTDALGTNIAPAFGADTAAPSFLLGAPGARARAGRLLIANASQGITHRFDGPRPGGRMSLGVVLGTAADFTVVAGLPLADSGRGALAFFSGSGAPRVRRGTAGARLGERVVVVDGTEIVAAAPGAGAVTRYSRRGDPRGSTSSTVPLFGTGLSSPGDLDGDGRDDLLVGFGLDPLGAELVSVRLLRQ